MQQIVADDAVKVRSKRMSPRWAAQYSNLHRQSQKLGTWNAELGIKTNSLVWLAFSSAFRAPSSAFLRPPRIAQIELLVSLMSPPRMTVATGSFRRSGICLVRRASNNQ